MTLVWLRDLVIVILAILGIVMAIGLTVMAIMLFVKANSIMNSIKNTAASLNRATSLITDSVLEPTIQVASFIQGVRRALAVIARLRGRKGG
ncbi:MAG TPA: hypothetical protein G4O03_05095 [Dehalococcoidia bacterium]|jgi:hypothetical protein|nr:hypothetical protein [Dehalococcoidia bacterium]